jgi:2'-5' RNA ligase
MSERQRLFFALWPSDELREALVPLQQLKQECGGRAVPTDNVHITLNFLGNVDADTRDCLEQAASEITIPPFQLLLDRYGYWRRPRVMWLGCSDMPEPLLHLVDALNRAVEGCGLQPERRPYHAHMTLLRKAKQAPNEPAPELDWPVSEFVLVESVSIPGGVEYRVLRRWPLKDGDR